MDAISPQNADKIIESKLRPLSAERVPFNEAYGRILREPVLADRDFPPFDRIMMDGIAIDYASVQARKFQSEGVQRAGILAMALDQAAGCFEVMTGAVLPQGCDTVIPVEEITESEGVFALNDGYQPDQGQFIHRQGSDNVEGDLLLPPGQLLSGKEIAVIATCGYSEVEVSPIPKITIVSTGDELVEVNETPSPFQIRKSNVYALEAACLDLPTPVEVELDHLPDDREVIAERVQQLLQDTDVLLFSGGISKGKYDFLQDVLAETGVEKHFQWVKQRPGKPLWFGTSIDDVSVFALPGNPNSTLTCFVRYVASSISQLAGIGKILPDTATLTGSHTFPPPLAHFLPVMATHSESGALEVEPLPTQNSGDLSRLALSSGFIELPADQKEFPVGFTAPFYPW
ncbi:MAG: molybdopterin molybdotransferase MoeA [Opitutales bacterium]|jgi:molybdopterin molybdotransferase|nr:molybdopterin molybdotransferase MoeA [Opitutales bacterium]